MGQQLSCCGSMGDVQRGCCCLRGQTVEQPLSDGQTAGGGTRSCTRPVDEGGESKEDCDYESGTWWLATSESGCLIYPWVTLDVVLRFNMK